jgi:hypothetical protein
MKTILTIIILLSFSVYGQQSSDTVGMAKTKISVRKWADSTFYKFTNPVFKDYKIDYTDEYNTAIQRKTALKKTIDRLDVSKSNNTLTIEEYERQVQMIKEKQNMIDKELIEQELVNGLSIIFSGNFNTKNGNTVFVEYLVTLTPKSKVANYEQVKMIGLYENDAIRKKK